jgi:DNA-binding protein H-NS
MSDINEFDTESTIMYKWVKVLMTPFIYLVVEPTTVRSIFDIISTMNSVERKNLNEIHIYITETLNMTLDVTDIAMAYYHEMTLPIRQKFSQANELQKEKKFAETMALREAATEELNYYNNMLFMIINDFYTIVNTNDAAVNLTAEIQVHKVSLLKDARDLEGQYEMWSQIYQASLQKDLHTLDIIEDVQRRLKETEDEKGNFSKVIPIKHTDPVIEMATHRYKVTWKDNTHDPQLVLNGPNIRVEDGIDIFNLAKTSFEVPYIQYNGNMDINNFEYEQPKRHIYYGNIDDNDETQLDFIILSFIETKNSHSLYFTVWTGTEKKNDQPQHSYVKCVYNLTTGTITIPAPVSKEGEKRVFNRVAAALPHLTLSDPVEIHVKGYFTIEQMNINQAILADMILNDPLFQVYLYIDESVKPRADKKRHNIHYKTYNPNRKNNVITGTGYISNTASVSISLGNYSNDDDDNDDFPANINSINVPKNEDDGTLNQTTDTFPSDMIKVKVTKAETRAVLNQFINIFTRLIRYYHQKKSSIAALYEQFIPGSVNLKRVIAMPAPSPVTRKTEFGNELIIDDDDDDDELPNSAQKGKKKGQSVAFDSKKRNMKLRAPDLIGNGYARQCQCKVQPIIIDESEVEDWVNRTFVDTDGIRKYRQIMPFPPPNPENPNETSKWLFVCPDDNAPRGSVKENPGASNSNIYPYVPCCGKTDELSNPNSKYYKFYEAKANPSMLAQPKSTTKAGYRQTTMKRLIPGRGAHIPPSLSRLLRSHTPNNELEDFARIGAPATTNSLIHCISLARHDQEYIQMQSYEEKEIYCQNIRTLIAELIHPYIYKQELYDISIKEIKNRLLDNKIFLDPYLYYRGVEEFFDINLFVFNPKGALHSLPGMSDADMKVNPVLELPRSKLTHIRPRRNRPNIIILKHSGAEGDAIPFPQCELIISRGRMINGVKPLEEEEEDNVTNTTIGYGANPIVTNEATYIFGNEVGEILFETVYESSRTLITSIVDIPGERSEVQTRDSPLNQPEWEYIFQKYRLVGQQIDAYGKLRMIAILNPRTKTPMCICIPPSQPLNLPIIDHLNLSPYDDVISIMGPPVYTHKSGLWYSVIDYLAAVFVPTVVDTQLHPPTPGCPPPPTNLNYGIDSNPINLYRKVERLANVFMQLMTWCWRLSRLDVISWMDKYVIVDSNVSEEPRNPIGLRRKLPIVNSCEEAISAMAIIWPSYFTKDKIRMYAKLAIKIKKYLINIQRITVGLPYDNPKVKPIEYLSKMYTREDDFISQSKSVVLIGNDHLNAWKEQQLQKHGLAGLITPIYHKLNISYATKTEPYLYQSNQTQKVYIVQSVRGGSRYAALNLCLQWYHNRINTGNSTPPVQENEIIPYVVYGISPAYEIIPVEDQSYGADVFMEILNYTPDQNTPNIDHGRYAALLPII